MPNGGTETNTVKWWEQLDQQMKERRLKMELYESALRFILSLPSNADDRLATKMRMIAAALDEAIMPPAPVARRGNGPAPHNRNLQLTRR